MAERKFLRAALQVGRGGSVVRRGGSSINFFRADLLKQSQIRFVTFAQNFSALDGSFDGAIGLVAVSAPVQKFAAAREGRELFKAMPQIFFVQAGLDQINRAETGRVDQKAAAEFQQLGDARGVLAAQNFFADGADFEF